MKNKDSRYNGLIVSIIVALGPVMFLFIDILNKSYKDIILNMAFIIFTFTFVLFNLRKYLTIQNTSNNITLKILKYIVSFMLFLFLILSLVIVSMAFYIIISLIQQYIFIKGDYIFYFIKAPYSYIIFVMLFMGCIFIIEKVYKVKKGFTLLDKIFAVLVILLIYILITSVVVVTHDGIYEYSFYNLKGKEYSFSDIEYVNTGFKDNGRNKGELYYNLQFKDGKKLELAYPSLSQLPEKYEHDTWQEYVDIDKYIMEAGAKKYSDTIGIEYSNLNLEYKEKLLKIINNK